MNGETNSAGGGSGGAGRRNVPVREHRHIQITPRDVQILAWVTRHGIVTIEQIAEHFFPGSWGVSSAQRRIRKLCETHPPLLRHDRTFWRQPPAIRVTASGARLAEVDLRPARLVPAEVQHAFAVVDLAEKLLASAPQGSTLITEREWRAERYRERATGARRTTGRIPDAVLLIPATDGTDKTLTVAVELDRTAKRETQMRAIVRQYQGQQFDAVWWYVRPRSVARITDIIKRLRADDFIEVRAWQPL